MILISVVLSLISILFFHLIIKYVSKNDTEIKVSKIVYIILTSIYLIFIYIFINIYGFSIEFIFKYIVLVYLVATAFIDFKTQYVYCFFNRFMGLVAILYIIYLNSHNFIIKENIEGILIAIIISLIFSFLKIWGEGDSEIFIVVSPFIAVYGLEYIIANFVLSMALSAIFNLIGLIAKKVDIKSSIAFAPYIATSSLLILLI